jgi:hypothetical protein
MDAKTIIINAFYPHIGRTVTYTPHKALPESQRLYSKFTITKEGLDFIHYFNLDKINEEIDAHGAIWAPIAEIAWGLGYHSVLYGNAKSEMFVQNGIREYVVFDE